MAAKRRSYNKAKPRDLVWTAPGCLNRCLLPYRTYLGLAFPKHPSLPTQAPPGCKIVVLVVVLRNSHTTSANKPCDPFVGVFFSSQELWRKTRRFTMTAMRDLGMGKRLAEERIIEELQFLIGLIKSFKGELGMCCLVYIGKAIAKTSGLLWKFQTQLWFCVFPGGPFQLRCLNTAPTNITFAILFGRRFDYEDPTFVTLLRLIDEVMFLLGSPFLHVSHPLCWEAPVSHWSW